MTWYYMKGQERQGPAELDEIKSMVSSGQLTENDLVWTKRMGDKWSKVSDVPELSAPAAPAQSAPPPAPVQASVFPQPSAPDDAAPAPKKRGGCGKAVGIGCLTIVLLLGLGGFVVVKKWKSIATYWVTSGISKALDESDLTPEEREAVMKPITALADDFKSGQIETEQMQKILEHLTGGPLFPLIMIKAFEEQYITHGDLSAPEKQAALKTTSRYTEAYRRGAIKDHTSMDQISSIVSVKTKDSVGDTSTELKESISPEDLKQCLAIMKSAADQAGIANRPYKLDLGKTVTDAITEARAAQGL